MQLHSCLLGRVSVSCFAEMQTMRAAAHSNVSVWCMQQNPVEVFSRSSIRQNESSSLHGDAQNVGLEEAMRRARRPF